MLVFVVDHFYEKCAAKLKKPPFYISVYCKLDFFELPIKWVVQKTIECNS